jgi:hypothetical protein
VPASGGNRRKPFRNTDQRRLAKSDFGMPHAAKGVHVSIPKTVSRHDEEIRVVEDSLPVVLCRLEKVERRRHLVLIANNFKLGTERASRRLHRYSVHTPRTFRKPYVTDQRPLFVGLVGAQFAEPIVQIDVVWYTVAS